MVRRSPDAALLLARRGVSAAWIRRGQATATHPPHQPFHRPSPSSSPAVAAAAPSRSTGPAWRSYYYQHQAARAWSDHQGARIGGSAPSPPSPPSSPLPPPSPDAVDANKNDAADGDGSRLVLYRGKWILPVRLLVRAKIFQLAGFGSVALAGSLLAAGDLSPTDAALLAALTAGCAGSAFSLWYYSSRYVGELALALPAGRRTLCVSALDFWGNRADAQFDARRLAAVVRGGGRTRRDEVERLTSQVLFPVNVVPLAEVVAADQGSKDAEQTDREEEEQEERRDGRPPSSGASASAAPVPAGERRQFYLSAVAGASPHPRLLMSLLDGSFVAARPWERAPGARTAAELERALAEATEEERRRPTTRREPAADAERRDQ